MGRFKLLVCCLMMGSVASIAVYTQSRGSSAAAVYEGARLIIGDASAAIDNGAFVVQNGKITAIGRKGAITVPAGATRTDLTGKTVIPALVNIHAHLGWELLPRTGMCRPLPTTSHRKICWTTCSVKRFTVSAPSTTPAPP
jgi:hypothetical protein